MKISELLKYAAIILNQSGINGAALDVALLLQTALQKPREFLITNPEEAVSYHDEKLFWDLVDRRFKREPIAYILGKKEFYGREFKITRDVLVPRPETELIIDSVLELYPGSAEIKSRQPGAKDHNLAGVPSEDAQRPHGEQSIKILDLGTGSGCILLTLMAELPESTGIGVDISNSALAIAAENAYNLGIANVEFVASDWCDALEAKQFNLIVSNPPYIPQPEQNSLEAELGYEPEMALFGGDDGLECYRKLAEEISNLEFEFAIFEIGINQKNEIEKIFDQYQIKLKETKKDLAGIERVMIFTKNKSNNITKHA